MALIATTVFLRTTMHRDSIEDGVVYTGALFFSLIMMMFNGMAEISLTIAKLSVFYKQRDLLFYPAWAFSVPKMILAIPIAMAEVAVWVLITYYSIGFDPSFER